MKNWKKTFKSSFSGFSLGDLTIGSWKSLKGFYRGKCSELDKNIKSAYQQALDLIKVMDLPFKVNLKLIRTKTEADNCLIMPTRVFDDVTLSNERKIIISTGRTIHEASHMRDTDMNVFNTMKLKGETFLKAITSLLEDERIEEKLLTQRPGFSSHIQEVRKYDIEWLENDSTWKCLKFMEKGDFFVELFSMIRYPEMMNEKIYEKYKEPYDKIKDILLKAEHNCTKECKNTGREIEKIVNEFLDDPSLMERAGNYYLQACNFDLMQKGMDDIANLSFSDDYHSTSTQINGSTSLDCKITQKDSEYGTNNDVTFTKAADDRDTYENDRDSILPYVSATRKLFNSMDKNYDFVVRGMRSGILDTNKIVEAYQGVPQVYTKQGLVRTNDTKICILIDQSGSMNRCNRIETARKAAILLKESLEGVRGIEFFIYGHTADNDHLGATELYIYKEGNHYNPKYALGSCSADEENRDGVAIAEVCERMRKFTDDHVILFVLSDGIPSANNYRRREAMDDVRSKVREYEKKGFDIIQINIGNELEESDMKYMFTNYIYLKSGLKDFPKLLSGIIKKAVRSDKTTKVQVL